MDDALQIIKQRFGDEAIYLLNAFPKRDVKTISTGSMLLDWATDVGGIPRGRYTELIGTESTAKTTLAQHIVANAQKLGLTCAYIDVENSLDCEYAIACGVDFNKMYLAQPGFAEETLGITEELVKSNFAQLVIIDSIAAMMPEKVGEDEFHHENTAGMKRASLLNDFFYRNTKYIRANDIAVVFTNQMRDNTKSQWGGYKGTGGHGLKHYASLRIRLSAQTKGQVKLGGEVIAQKIDAVIKKNKVGRPYRTCQFTVLLGKGIDRPTDVLATAVFLGVVVKVKAIYTLDGEVIGKGEAKTIRMLGENPLLVDDLEGRCKEILDE